MRNLPCAGPHARLLPLLAVVTIAAGCRSATPLAPAGLPPSVAAVGRAEPVAQGFYPLAPGSRWRYHASLVRRLLRSDGTTQVLADQSFTIETELTCADSAGGHDWLVERTTESFADGSSARAWTLLRQDREGLWAARLGTLDPCTGAATPSDVREEQRLGYPLRPGMRWVSTPGFFPVVDSVEAVEPLDLPVGRVPAWRIRVDRPGIWKPGRDRSQVWYGRAGLVKLETHLEDDVVENGVVTGVIEAEMRQVLDRVELATPGRFADRDAIAQRMPRSLAR